MTMKGLPLLLATALLLAPATADDQLRDVQAALKTQGFYYGEVTGKESAETDAATRRFQIRNGITVTGKLNAETLAALGFAVKKDAGTAPPTTTPAPAPPPSPAPAPEPEPAPQPVAPKVPAQKQLNPPPAHDPAPKPGEPVLPSRKERALPPDNEPAPDAQTPARRPRLNDPSVIDPPTPLPAPVHTQSTTMFRDTPYATAPREVQAGLIRRAQQLMAARQQYHGPIDGIASGATGEAIFLFQEETSLRRTGRLDNDTLAEMKLLPQPARGNPLLKPFYNPNRRRDSSVLPE